MSTHNIESATKSGTFTLHVTAEVPKVNSLPPYAVIFTHDGSYTYRLIGDTADTTSVFKAGVIYPIVLKHVRIAGAPAGATTCTILYRG